MQRIANVLLQTWMCLMMALCFGTLPVEACSQSLSQQSLGQQKTQTATTGQLQDMTGTWRLQANASSTNQRLQAIENAIGDMPRFARSRARKMMKMTTAPDMEFKITDLPNKISFVRAGREIEIPTNGQSVSVVTANGKAALQAQRRDGKLAVVSKMRDATRTAIYSLSNDGNNLTEKIQIKSGKLPNPIEFSNVFTR